MGPRRQQPAQHSAMAKVSRTLVRFPKPNQVAFYLDRCSWPTGPEAIGQKSAPLSWVKFVYHRSGLHPTKSVREKYFRDVVSQVMEQECSSKQWEAKAITLDGRLCSEDLTEPDFNREVVVARSSMIHNLVTVIPAAESGDAQASAVIAERVGHGPRDGGKLGYYSGAKGSWRT